jgi:hypothetical protein
MADIGSVGGFNPATTRSAFEEEAATRRRVEERSRQEEIRETQRDTTAEQQAARAEETARAEEVARAEAVENDGRDAALPQSEELQDTVTLSNAAQEFLVEQQNEIQAANDDAAVQATEASDNIVEIAQAGGVTQTNQVAVDEENTSVVNGNQDSQSEQTRTLGQIVDQFA